MVSTVGIQKVERAVEAGQLSAESGKNIKKSFVGAKEGSVERVSLDALVGAEEWGELNDRFFRTLAFGTGGIAGANDWEGGDEGGGRKADRVGSPRVSSSGNELHELWECRASDPRISELFEEKLFRKSAVRCFCA